LLKSLLNAVSDKLEPRANVRAMPIFPLGTVLFPDGVMALKIFETRYMDMAKLALKQNSPFGICLIVEGAEVGAPALPERIGTAVHIVEWDMQNLGVLQVRVRGEKRFRIRESETTKAGLIVAQVEMFEHDMHEESSALSDCALFLQKILLQLGSHIPASGHRFDDAFWVGARLAELLPLGNTIKQKMLELTNATMRLELLQRFLRDQGLLART
jgi:uncharacterized protein